MTGMLDLVVIRHGETDWNRQQRFQGQIDIALNAMGLEQANRLGQHLAQSPTDVLICSDLQRARQTAAPLAAAWKSPAGCSPPRSRRGCCSAAEIGRAHV